MSMQTVNMDILSTRESDPLPPPYPTVVYKFDENEFDQIPPPAYSDIDNPSIVYINNYPGPPLTDGCVPVIETISPGNPNFNLSKSICRYLILNGIMKIFFGLSMIGLQITIIVLNSIDYYYYGFWGGGILVTLGISTLLLYKRRSTTNRVNIYHSFFCQMLVIILIFVIGLIILLTDKCDDNDTEDNGTCQHSYKILNGFLFGIFAFEFLLSIVNTIIFGFLKRQQI